MVTIACIGMMVIFVLFTIGPKLLPPKELGYDVKRVRELEMEIWGYYFTPLPEDEKPKALPVPPKGDAGCSKDQTKTPKCSICKVPFDYDGWCSNECVKAYRDSLRQQTRACANKACSQLTTHADFCQRCRMVGVDIVYPQSRKCHRCNISTYAGMDTCQPCTKAILEERRQARQVPTRTINGMKIRVPSGVPDNAHASMDYDPNKMVDRVHWTWIDPETGRTKRIMSMVPVGYDYSEVTVDELLAPVAKRLG